VLEIEVPASAVDSEMESVVREFRRKTVLPGFRRGKVPVDLLQAQFGHTMETEFLKRIVPSAYEKAVEKTQLYPVTMPEIGRVNFRPGRPLTFQAVVEVKPSFEVKGYRNMKLTREQYEVESWQVEEVLKRLREDAAILSPVDREAREGDVLRIDYRRVDKKGNPMKGSQVTDYVIELGSPTVLEDFSRALLGAKAGERRRVEVNYPKDFPQESLAGSQALFQVKVKEINEKILRELDDNFAREVAKVSDLAALKSRIMLNLETSERLKSQEQLEDRVVEKLLQENQFDLPEGLVTGVLETALERSAPRDSDKEAERERLRPMVERSLRRQLILEAIGRAENLEVSDEEIEKGLREIAEERSETVEAVRKRFREEDRMGRFVESLLERKVLNWILEHAEVEKVTRKRPRMESSGREG